VAAADDREAEDIVNRLQARGYALASPVEPGSRQPPGDGAADSHHEGRLSLVAQSPE
jgi:hypothetical protein